MDDSGESAFVYINGIIILFILLFAGSWAGLSRIRMIIFPATHSRTEGADLTKRGRAAYCITVPFFVVYSTESTNLHCTPGRPGWSA